MTGEIVKFLSIAWEAANAAGEIIRACWQHPKTIDYKGAIDLVTTIDRETERKIVEILQRNFPDHSILAEEETDLRGDDNEYRWIIDPLDGTTNFVHGYPQVSISVGLEQSGRLILGLVYDPLRRECFRAVKDQGATLNGSPIQISTVKELDKALIATGSSGKTRFLSNIFQSVPDPLPGHPAGGLCGPRSLLRCLRAHRWFLGAQSQTVGHSGRLFDRR
jgi:fructose-1,6-bisphosphatase/inositol monophosphatase family enzyme